MIQFYLLSVVLNALVGYLFITGGEDGVLEFKGGFSLKDRTVQFVLGILSAVTGLFKILSPVEGNVPVIGDLVPGLIGIVCGFILVFEYYKTRTTMAETEQTEKIGRILLGNKKLIGMAALASAVLHFIFPKVLLL
jgi:hypothetical protein